MVRWVEHYGEVYGEESEIDVNEIRKLPSFNVMTELDGVPTFDEIKEAIKQMANDKSPGDDTIPADVGKGAFRFERCQIYTTI